jgi:hypothetical protein
MNLRLPFNPIIACLLLVVVLFPTCAKEYSYEGGPINRPTPVSAELTCTGTTITGTYSTDVVLDTTNLIRLQVNVTTAGAYTISTNTANGIRFSGTGTLSFTGPQTITLAGSGIPLNQGDFTFSITGASCSFTITVNKPSDVKAEYSMPGAPNACTEALVNGNYINGTPLNSSNNIILKVNVKTIGNYVIRTLPINGISFADSGTFIKTGDQIVTLAGNGTPLQPDNLIFNPSPSSGNPVCGFQVTIVNRDPIAAYTFESGIDTSQSCVSTVSGTYSKNTPLSGSNNIRINVLVTALGNYTIATDLVNGMRFYHTGMFTIKGSQTVTLSGIGTPLVSGNSFFMPQIIGNQTGTGQSCRFTISVN